MKYPLLSIAFCLTLSACDFSCAGKKTLSGTPLPHFDENLAYSQILAYEKFGPKVPGTDASVKAGDWILAELKNAGITGIEQKTTAVTFDKHTIPVRNIIGQFNPAAKTRYLLSAHWDNRPFSDEDPDPKFKMKPVPGVNDGGSGVVVLLGIAKALQGKTVDFGVDFLFLDAEDWGTPYNEESYCLGTQYWAAHPIPENYHARFGINYDMVGRIGAIFPAETYSAQRAPEVMNKLREAAKKLGYAELFPNLRVGPVVDDHIYLMQRGFPVYDLIQMTPDGRFPPEWHKHSDTSEFISRDVLKAVGRTTLQVFWDDQSE
jgi:Zn-dependent M28 family amino/carboxypeptidase